MQTITVDEVHRRMQAGEKLNLVDVREPHENADYNIGGILYPVGRVQSYDIDELEKLKDEEVILYCRSGSRSGNACLILETMGFKNVKNLTGGMLAWRDKFEK